MWIVFAFVFVFVVIIVVVVVVTEMGAGALRAASTELLAFRRCTPGTTNRGRLSIFAVVQFEFRRGLRRRERECDLPEGRTGYARTRLLFLLVLLLGFFIVIRRGEGKCPDRLSSRSAVLREI